MRQSNGTHPPYPSHSPGQRRHLRVLEMYELTATLCRMPLVLVCSLWVAWAGCDDANRVKITDEDPAQAGDGGAGKPTEDACAKAEPGTGCGSERHCINGRCTANLCGDGFALGSEQCDDGNETTGDGCSPSCTTPSLTCGDGLLQGLEECDDGNWFASDSCSNDCTKNECGNQREDDVEECDDGNRVDDDACSNQCTENRCRNGRLDAGEECDDGNTTHDDPLLFSSDGQRIQGDVCSNGCVSLICGNARTEDKTLGGSEECDDGNMVNEDACSNACTANKCGNKRIDPGELCDGNTASQDCSADCRSLSQNTACEACRQANCTNYGGALDLVAGCYGENPSDAKFNDDCRAIVSCAKRTSCAYTAAGLPLCFCGTFDQGACQTTGNQNGPCIPETFVAARTEMVSQTIERFGATDFPVGMAFYLLQCEQELCFEQCVSKP